MRDHTAALSAALAASFNKWYTADILYDGQRVIADAPLSGVQITEDDSQFVKATGQATVTIADDWGASNSPQKLGDTFAPFGTQLDLYCMIQAGTYTERVPMGVLEITEVPTAVDSTMFFRTSLITVGSSIQLTLQDLFVRITRDDFDVPSSPSQTASVYTELQSLTGMTLVRSVPDQPVASSIAYAIGSGGRQQAVLDLSDLLAATPYADPTGNMAFRPKTWPAPVDVMRRGDGGSIVSIGKGMSSNAVYNKVVFRGQDGTSSAGITSIAEITSGPLRTSDPDGTASPAGRRPYAASNQFINTKAQADAYTASQLPIVSSVNASSWPIVETFNPLRELGDVLTVVDEHGAQVSCRITGISRDESATQTVTVTRAS